MSQSIRILALFGARVLFGQERANIETLVRLRERGCEVLCVVRDEDWPELIILRDEISKRGLRWVKVPYIDYPVKGWMLHAARRNPSVFFRANRALPRIAADFGATHIHSFNPVYVANFLWALHKMSLPLIYRCGDQPVHHNALFRWVWSFVKRRANFFVADSEFISRELEKTGIENGRISVIYAPAPRRLHLAPVPLPAAATAEGAFRFVFVGQLTRQKGIDILIEAFRLVIRHNRHLHLIIAGRISDSQADSWARELCVTTMSDQALAGNIHFVGFVENVPDLIGRCQVHVAPSVVQEGYGLVVVEAKEAGRPSIIFRSGGMSELVTDNVDGITLSDKSVPALAVALERYACEPSLAEVHGQAARASVQALHIPAFGDRWHQVYLNSLRAPSSQGG